MPYIPLEEHLPGITGLLEYRKDTAKPIRELTQFLLRGPSTLTKTERELIATVVSSGNDCTFCTAAHASAVHLLSGDATLAEQIRNDHSQAGISEKMKALLDIAAAVRVSGKSVSPEMIEKAKAEGATDIEIHDTVLIAALFCLYNRYVDGLATALPHDAAYYNTLGDRIVNHGYTRLPQGYDHLKNQPH
jgi:uncharacterized peroxidase-related enzyme